MNLAAALLAPFALLFSAIGSGGGQDNGATDAERPARAYPEIPMAQDAPEWPLGILRTFVPQAAQQVHIEQRMTIRVSPRAAVQPRAMPPGVPRFSERKIGKCLPISAIVGVEPNEQNSLILFLRDRRMINVELDRTCRSRAFYSGFYLSRSNDGQVCVNRDTLHSRSGSACKLTRMRQLVPDND